MSETEYIKGKSKRWLQVFAEAKLQGLTIETVNETDMGITDMMVYIAEHKEYNKAVKQVPVFDAQKELEAALKEFDNCETLDQVKNVWEKHSKWQTNPEFIRYKDLAKRQLQEPELGF